MACSLESMVAVRIVKAGQSEEVVSSWPTAHVALLYCERDAGETLKFTSAELGVWVARTQAAAYQISLGRPFQERDLIITAAIFNT